MHLRSLSVLSPPAASDWVIALDVFLMFPVTFLFFGLGIGPLGIHGNNPMVIPGLLANAAFWWWFVYGIMRMRRKRNMN